MENHFSEFQAKMERARVTHAAIQAFRYNYETLLSGKTGTIPESEIQPVESLPDLRTIGAAVPQVSEPAVSQASQPAERKIAKRTENLESAQRLLSQSVVLKLNGGLGTSMGLEQAKSLLPVKNGLTFLDFIVRQILHLRTQHGAELPFLLMNSFSTSEDTLAFLRQKYPELGDSKTFELMQNQVPKVDAASLAPASWPANPELEWCPPGHGDLYTTLEGSGTLDRLLQRGIKYMFVSNSDNLGATLDLPLLTYFAASGHDFLMEVAERTASDRKGGHLAKRNGKLLLRESAQCREEDSQSFQDIQRHRFFNTNSLWIRLDKLKELVRASGGFIKLPLIKNSKTVDPRDKKSPNVFQLETAMGAAIESFENAAAVVVPRSRFAPVKTTSDLFALRSDAFTVTKDWRLELDAASNGGPPTMDLDADFYKLVDQLDALTKSGVPSLKRCTQLKVTGPIAFNSGNVFAGKVEIVNGSKAPAELPPRDYRDEVVRF